MPCSNVPRPYTHHIRIDQAESPRCPGFADSSMFCQRFTDPSILSFIRPDNDNQVVPDGIVGMKKIGDHPQQAQAPGKYDKFVLVAKLREAILLVFKW